MAMAMVMGGFGLADDHEATVASGQHLDLNAKEGAQVLGRDHRADRSLETSPVGDVEDLVKRRKQWVHIVGDKQGGNLLPGADLANQPDHRGLVGEVETVEGFVENQQARLSHNRLGDQDPLLFAAGELAKGALGVPLRPDKVDNLVDPSGFQVTSCAIDPRDREAPPWSVESKAHDLAGPNPCRRLELSVLGEISDLIAAIAGGCPQDGRRALCKGEHAEQYLEQRGLSGTVRPKDGGELALGDREIEIRPNGASTDPHGRRAHVDHGRRLIVVLAVVATVCAGVEVWHVGS
jgi:hypothetical protein